MKIVGPGEIRNSDIKKTKKKAGEDGLFSSMLSAGEVDQPSAPVAAMPAAIGMISLQEVDAEAHSRQQYVKRGEDLLDFLDRIRHGLLAGGIPRQQLLALQVALQHKKAIVMDPRLRQLVEEIEVRAAVELAKLENNL
jgi:hypothetical protein